MKKSGQNLVVILLLLLVIIIATAFIIKTLKPPPKRRPVVDWTCEECGHRFVDELHGGQRVCPECGGEAVTTFYMYCSVHDHLFEAYRSKPNPEVDPEDVIATPEKRNLYKLPDGEWTRQFPTVITCPQGNSDRSTLKYCPPTAKERQQETR